MNQKEEVRRQAGEIRVLISGASRSGQVTTTEILRTATDPLVEWRKGIYDRGDHTHCLLTFDAIDDGETAYQAGPNVGWITVEAYEKYVRDDVLRLRRVSND
jgi:hypothetical protein